jgi:LysM repeat protein
VAYVEGQLALISDANLVAGTAVSLYGYIQIADIHRTDTALTTDYGYQRIGGNDPAANKNGVLDGNLMAHQPSGANLTHMVHAGDTLQSIAAQYYGSPSYWYLIADANGLTGAEALKEGTMLTIPDRVANSFNNFDTFNLYSANDIIGTTTPGLRFKKGLYQQWEQVIVTIVSIVVMIVVAIYAPYLLGYVGALLAGFVAGYAVSVAGQTANVDAGLQTKVDYKQARKMGTSLALSVLGGELLGWANTAISDAAASTNFDATIAFNDAEGTADIAKATQGLSSASQEFSAAVNGTSSANAIARVGIEVGKQLLQNHGKITNVTGLIGAYFGADVSSGWGAVAIAGLKLAESGSRNKHQTSNLDWFDFATSVAGVAINEYGKPDQSAGGTGAAPTTSGLNWTAISQQAVFNSVRTFVAYKSGGENAAYNALGNGFGEFLTEGVGGMYSSNPLVASFYNGNFGRALGNGVEQVSGLFNSSTPTTPTTIPNDGYAKYRDTGFLYENGSPFAEQLAFNPTLNLNGENASAPPINTAGETLTNSALTQARGAVGGGDVTLGTAPAPIVGVPSRTADQTQTDPGLFESALNWLIPTANAAEFPPLRLRTEYPANGSIVVKSNEPGTVILGGEGITIVPLTPNTAVKPDVNSLNTQAEQTAKQDAMAAQTISERSIMFQSTPNQDTSVFVPGFGNMVITDNPTTAGGNAAGHPDGESGHTEENSLLKDLNPGRAVDSGIKLGNALFAQSEKFKFTPSALYPETSGGIAGSRAANEAVGLPENMRRTRIDNPEFLKAKGFDPNFLGSLSEGFHPGKLGGMLNWADTAFDTALAYWHYRNDGNTPKFAGEVGNAVTKTVTTTVLTTAITVEAAIWVPLAIAEWPILATVGIAVGTGYLVTIGYDKIFSKNISSAFTDAYNKLTK